MSRKVFACDVEAIARAEVLVAVLDGRTVDEGVAFELGVAFAFKKICVGFRSDSRVLLPFGINPMIQGAITNSVSNITQLRKWAASARSRIS
jgi:nucleoside 2-deoxyribosyltransferase